MIGGMMPNKKSLTRAEAMEIFHQDGVLEIVLGVTLLNFGFTTCLTNDIHLVVYLCAHRIDVSHEKPDHSLTAQL